VCTLSVGECVYIVCVGVHVCMWVFVNIGVCVYLWAYFCAREDSSINMEKRQQKYSTHPGLAINDNGHKHLCKSQKPQIGIASVFTVESTFKVIVQYSCSTKP